MSYLDRLPEFNNKAILVQSTLGYQMAMAYLGYRDVGLENLESGSYLLGDFEDNNGPFNNVQLASPNESLFDSLSDEITWYNQLLGVANDTDQSEDTRLKCLTELVDQARLNEVPLLPYNPVITPQTNIPPSALVIHNETTGVEGVGFLHIGPVELALIYSARQSFDSFAQITGVYTDNASLVGGFATKEDLITPSGDAAQFWNGNKAFAAVAFNQLASTPTTLAGYGISASDTLFDNKYLQLGSQLQTLNTTSGTPLTTTTTVIEGFGRLQNQVSARELSLGNPAVNGYVLSSTTAGVRSWIPVPSGTAVTGISLTGTNGITGAVVITAGNAVITAGTNRTGMLKGNGTAISAATEMTDYIGITGAADGDTIVYDGTAGVATWAPGLSNPMDTLGDMIIGGALGATTKLAGNTTTTRKFLMSVGASGAALAQTYETLLAGDIPDIAIAQVTNLQTTLDQRLSDNLLSGQIFIGNLSDLATGVVPSGDWTIDTTGVATIEPNAVTFDKFIQATGPQILVGTPDILGVQDFRQITLDPATLQIDAFGVMSSIATGTGTVTNTNTLTLNSLVLGDGGTAVKVGGGFTTDGVSQLTLGVSGTSVGGLLLTNITSGTIELRPVTGALGTTVLTLFAGSDTLVGLAATQTLTNKTLTNPQINGALLQTSSTVGYVWTATNTTGAGSWQAPTGGGGSGTVTSIATAGLISGGTITTTGTITTSMATNKLVGRGTAGTGIMEEITLGTGLSLTGTTLNATGGGSGTVTSVDLTMPTAFSVTGNPITTSGTLAVTGAGTVSQYVRGDGTLGIFPSTGGGGGGTVYYLNGNTSQGSIGGTTMYQLSPAAGTGAAADFQRSTTGAIASFITDVSSPNQTSIPAGIWIFECYLSETGSGANHAEVNAVVEKWDGTSITVIGTGPIEEITNGSTKDLYQFAVTIPSGTTILATDRIVIQINISNAHGKTVTLYTENGNVSSVITTFATGISSLNGLTASTQFLGAVGTTGTAPAWTSTTATHTLNIPLASAASVTAGLISNTEFNTFNDKMSNPMTAEGDIIYGDTGGVPIALARGSDGRVLTLAGGVPVWGTVPSMVYPGAGIANSTGTSWGTSYTTTGSGTVLALATSPTFVTPVLGAATGTSLDVTGALTSGVASTTAGTLVLRNASSAFTQTIRGTNPAASIIYDLPTTAPTAGQVLSSSAPSAGVATLSWATVASGSTALSAITAAAAGNTIANADFAQVWNWATLAANTALTLGSVGVTSGTILSVTHSTSALTGNLVNIASTANITTGRLLNISSAGTTMTGTTHAGAFISLTGASAAASVTTTGIDVTNTRTGTTSVNIGGRFTATGGTTNYPLISVNNVAGTSGLHDLAALVGRQAAANDAASVSFYANSLSSANRVVSLKSLFSNPGYNFVLDLFGNTAITEALRIVGTLDAMNMGFGTNAPTAKFHLKHTGTGAALGNISQGMMLLESVSQTNIAIGSEVNGVNFNFTATKGFAATAGTRVTTNQREFLVSAPTYNATTSAYVITNAATMAITAAPTASTNMTFTNTAMALWVQAGLVRFDGDLIVGASAVTPSARLQVRGASGANTAFLVQVNNTTTKVIEAGSTAGGAATLGLYGVTADVRPTNAITAAAFVPNTSLIANDTATYGTYTMGQVVASLIRLGILT